MSQHNIVGSEAFDRSPLVLIRSMRPGGMRRRRARTTVAFVAGAATAVVVGAGGLILAFAPALTGA